MSTVLLVLLSAVFFCAMILNLAAKPKMTKGLIGACTLLAAIGGILFYGFGFSYVLKDPVQIIVRTVFNVSRMFAGVNDLGSISSAPFMQYGIMITLFWVVHLMAFYAMASATISALGATALKKLKYWLQRYGASVIIYGINEESVEFGRSLYASGMKNIVFVASKPDAALESAINAFGALVRSDPSALKPDLKFLKSLGSEKGSPVLTLYAFELDDSLNFVYAHQLLGALQAENVNTDHIRLVLRGQDDSVESDLSRSKDRYGYADVAFFTDCSVAARLLMQTIPPYTKMTFDKDGLAEGDFDAVVVGFGRTGRAALRYLVRNAQFEGSTFHVGVFSPFSEKEKGYFFSSYPGLVEQYDIGFHTDDAGSVAFYDYLKERIATLRYIIICTGNKSRDAEIASEIASFLGQRNSKAAICRCNSKAISYSLTPRATVQYKSTYSADVLAYGTVDSMAMMLNYSYVNDPAVTPEDAWSGCDFFSRESSRASADFIHAYIAMAGLDEESALKEDGAWASIGGKLKENLGRTEHLRWCAFHYSMGFTCMKEETLRLRGELYRRQMEEEGKASVRISKDLISRTHGCLCTWEELDALAELEQEYTGKLTDYKDMDIRNVMALPAVIRAAKEYEGKGKKK